MCTWTEGEVWTVLRGLWSPGGTSSRNSQPGAPDRLSIPVLPGIVQEGTTRIFQEALQDGR